MPFGAEGLSHVTVIEETVWERGVTMPTPEGAVCVHMCVCVCVCVCMCVCVSTQTGSV